MRGLSVLCVSVVRNRWLCCYVLVGEDDGLTRVVTCVLVCLYMVIISLLCCVCAWFDLMKHQS